MFNHENFIGFFARLCMFAPLNFAAGATALGDGGADAGADAGAGGGSDAGDAGAGDGGDGGDAGDAGGTAEGDGSGAPGTDDSGRTDGQSDGKTDGRTLPQDLKKTIGELRKENPKLADQIQHDHFKVRQFEAEFKTPAQAREAKDFIERVGGEDGLAELQSHAKSIEMVDNSVRDGNPVVLDDMVADFPEGFKKLVPHAVERLAKLDPAAHESLVNGLTAQFLESKNVYSHVEALMKAIHEGKQEDSFELAQQLSQFLRHYRENGGRQRQNDSELDAGRKKLADDRAAFDRQKAEEAEGRFSDAVVQSASRQVTAEADRILNGLLGQLKIPDTTRMRIMQDVFAKIQPALAKKEHYLKRYDALYAERDVKRMTNFVVAQTKEILPTLVKEAKAAFVLGGAPREQRRPNGGGQRSAQGGNQNRGTVNKRPTLDEARAQGFSVDEWLASNATRKLERGGRVYFRW